MGRRLRIEADGGARNNPGPAGYGAVVRDADSGEVLAEVAAGIGTATNNVAEYRGLIAGLEAASAVADVESVEVRMDSLLVVQQMSGRWKVKHPGLQPLHAEAKVLVEQFPRVRFTHIARELNGHADRLANEAMDAAARGEVWQLRGTKVAPDAAAESAEEQLRQPPNRLSGWMAAPAPPTTTWLLRHGQTALSVDKRFSGLGDPELSETGRAQAAAAAGRLARRHAVDPIAAIYSSPLQRAQATAEAVGELIGVPVKLEERLRETDFGAWEGYTFGEVRTQWPDELSAWLADPAVPPPDGESFVDTMKRVLAARADLVAAHPAETILLVSHVTPIKTLLRHALEAPATVLYRLHLDLASLCHIEWFADSVAVVRTVNDTGHLEAPEE